MEKKHSGKKSNEECKPGCKGRIIGPDTYCRCIERLLPTKRGGRKSVSLTFIETIEQFPNQEEYYRSSNEDSLAKVASSLRQFGLVQYEVDLIVARFLEEKTLEEIMQEQGWLNRGSTLYHIKKILKKLKELEFQFK